MRKDLGVKRTAKGDLLGFFVNDIKEFMKKKKQKIILGKDKEFTGKLKTCLNQIKGLEHRKYTPRILDELFENVSQDEQRLIEEFLPYIDKELIQKMKIFIFETCKASRYSLFWGITDEEEIVRMKQGAYQKVQYLVRRLEK